MAHSLKLDVIAEGVETAAQLAYLQHHRCDQVQGYYFSPPLPVRELEALLEAGGMRERVNGSGSVRLAGRSGNGRTVSKDLLSL